MSSLLKVKTKSGWVEGYPAGNQTISLFKGIPFAAPPVGELRWKAPQPVEPWEGIKKCYEFAPIAWQERRASEGGGIVATEFYCRDYEMSEDCLYLNIWTPAGSSEDKLPVGVYVHGGGYMTGYSYLNCYDGEAFAKRGIIIVTVSYRLNAFGFLAHPELSAEADYKASGNYGTLDQIAALKWVKENIEAFGGDPEQITVFGQSAGGGSTQTLCATPLTKGFFKRAIMQSAGAMWQPSDYFNESWTGRKLKDAEAIGVKFFDFLGVKSLSEARAVPAEILSSKLKEYSGKYGRIEFCPIVDGYVLPQNQTATFKRALHEDLDYMIGSTSEEMYRADAKAPSFDAIASGAKARFGNKAEEYLKVVRADEPEKADFYFKDVMGDNMLAGNLAYCINQNKIGYKPTYIYYFTHLPAGAETVHHSAEHHYVFQTLNRSTRPYTGWDWDLSNQLCDYWSNFIKTGNPNGIGIYGTPLPEWTPYTAEKPEGLIIADTTEMGIIPEKDNIKFMVDYVSELEL